MAPIIPILANIGSALLSKNQGSGTGIIQKALNIAAFNGNSARNTSKGVQNGI